MLPRNPLSFLRQGIAIVGLVILLVVGVWVYLQYGVFRESSPAEKPSEPSISDQEVELADKFISLEPAATTSSTPLITEPIPLSEVPLNETQRQFLNTLGVDVETMVITPSMGMCAERALGRDRLKEIVDGATPSALEAISITPCINQ